MRWQNQAPGLLADSAGYGCWGSQTCPRDSVPWGQGWLDGHCLQPPPSVHASLTPHRSSRLLSLAHPPHRPAQGTSSPLAQSLGKGL